MFYWQLVKNRVIIVECYSGKLGAASRVSHDSSEERTCPFDSLTLRRDSHANSVAEFARIQIVPEYPRIQLHKLLFCRMP